VATTFVIDAASKIVSMVIGSTVGTSARLRYLLVDLAVALEVEDAAGQLVRGDGAIDRLVDLAEAIGIEGASALQRGAGEREVRPAPV